MKNTVAKPARRSIWIEQDDKARTQSDEEASDIDTKENRGPRFG